MNPHEYIDKPTVMRASVRRPHPSLVRYDLVGTVIFLVLCALIAAGICILIL